MGGGGGSGGVVRKIAYENIKKNYVKLFRVQRRGKCIKKKTTHSVENSPGNVR